MVGNNPNISEIQLIDGLKNIRFFVLAQVLYHFMDAGILESIENSQEITVSTLASKLNMRQDRLNGFLLYLANESYVRFNDNETVSLTKLGKEIKAFFPWYKLLVGGYAETFQQLSDSLAINGDYTDRDSSNVAVGSCGISQHDALPMTKELINSIPKKVSTVVDLGCGDGSYLIDLCNSFPDLKGVGIDLNPYSINLGEEKAKEDGIDNKITFLVGDKEKFPNFNIKSRPLCFITAFVLQEILEQSGEIAIIALFEEIFQQYPDSYWIVIEVDHRPTDSSVMSTGLGLAYYNPYYLIHNFTEQKLKNIKYWENLFKKAGVKILSYSYPNVNYDPLKLKVGFLLSKC